MSFQYNNGFPLGGGGGGGGLTRSATEQPAGTKCRAAAPIDELAEEVSSSDSDDGEYEPPPRSRGAGARGQDGGLREHPQQAAPRYWDHENHIAAVRAELAELEGVTWDEIDASEGDSNCDIESEDEEEEDEEEEEEEEQKLEDPL